MSSMTVGPEKKEAQSKLTSAMLISPELLVSSALNASRSLLYNNARRHYFKREIRKRKKIASWKNYSLGRVYGKIKRSYINLSPMG
jgi:hypothetical protein